MATRPAPDGPPSRKDRERLGFVARECAPALAGEGGGEQSLAAAAFCVGCRFAGTSRFSLADPAFTAANRRPAGQQECLDHRWLINMKILYRADGAQVGVRQMLFEPDAGKANQPCPLVNRKASLG